MLGGELNKALYNKVVPIIENSKNRVLKTINQEIVRTYWQIGKEIVEEEQNGKNRAEYGKTLIETLAQQLIETFGKSFNARNLWQMRKFYEQYPILNAVRSELTWTHYRLLIMIKDLAKRSFYEVECSKNQWSTRELERQINSLLFERLTGTPSIKYTLAENQQQIFASRYKLYLPTEEELRIELITEKEILENNLLDQAN